MIAWFKKKIEETKDKRRAFTQTQKTQMWYDQEWLCKICWNDLDLRTVRYDHIKRHSEGWETRLNNWQALCSNCHSKKTFDENLQITENK